MRKRRNIFIRRQEIPNCSGKNRKPVANADSLRFCGGFSGGVRIFPVQKWQMLKSNCRIWSAESTYSLRAARFALTGRANGQEDFAEATSPHPTEARWDDWRWNEFRALGWCVDLPVFRDQTQTPWKTFWHFANSVTLLFWTLVTIWWRFQIKGNSFSVQEL